MKPRAWRSRTLAGIGLALALSVAAPGHAAAPPLAKSQASDQSASAPPSLDERAAAVQERLAQAHARLSALPPDQTAAPPEASATEWAEYQRLLNLLGNAYESHLDSLNKLKDIRQSRKDLQDKSADWQGFPEPGPYPVDFVDDLWNQLRAKDREIASARLEQSVFESLLDSQRLALKNAEQELRKSAEQLESADPLQKDRNRWLQDLSELRKLSDEAKVAAYATEGELRTETLAYRLAERELLQRQTLAASRVSPLSAADRDAKLAALAQTRRTLEAEVQREAEVSRAAQSRLQQARERLREARERPAPPPEQAEAQAKELERLQQELDTCQAEAESSGLALKILNLRTGALVVRSRMWEQRYRIEHAQEPATLSGAMAEIQQGLNRVAAWREFLGSDLDTTRRRVDSQDKRLADWKPEYGERALAERERLAFVQREAVLRHAFAEANDLDTDLRSLGESVRFREESASLDERLRGFATQAGAVADKLWDFELLAVEDRIVAEGREIVGKRSVTVGKLLQVLLILGLGLWLTQRTAGHGRRFLMRRMPGRESAALLGLRLFNLLAVVGLVVFALMTVNIPLTVFAFMGGALAIGVGFGAQNILNNFISGLILLVERPIKLGDIVDVEGVRGRVTHIGGRCCQVRRFDGIDMLIPNSSFLEKNVTNWTLSDQHLRCTLTVGAAYGSPVRVAMGLVKRAATEHPLVMREPAPEVYLEEFADSALTLRLDFWLDLLVESNWRRVTSDIRQNIDALFNENGIVIAFPQRDVRLDSARPLKIELVPVSPAAGSRTSSH